jgi:hypothetical protein
MEIDFYKGTNPVLAFTIRRLHEEYELWLEVKRLVHGGRSGREKSDVAKHVGDLESFGIKHAYPPLGPVAFLLPTFNATTSHRIAMYDNANNAEVESVLLVDKHDNIYVTVGSDHTDREMERSAGPPKAKLLAPKVMASEAWPYEEVKDHWNDLVMRAYAYRDGEPDIYQDEKLGANFDPETLMENTRTQIGLDDLRSTVMFGGTIPSLKGEFVFGKGWDLELFDPVLKRSLKHHYDVEVVWHRVPPYPTAERPPEL